MLRHCKYTVFCGYCAVLQLKEVQLLFEGTALVASQVMVKQEVRIHFYVPLFIIAIEV
jgi:hypothetical protein